LEIGDFSPRTKKSKQKGKSVKKISSSILLICIVALNAFANDPTQWPVVGSNNAGQRFTTLNQITPDNVKDLAVAWTYHHGDFSGPTATHGPTAFQVTPLAIDGTLYFCTPYNRVIALDALSGKEKWKYDPKVNLTGVYSALCRGVSYWQDPAAEPASACAKRIFTGTLDARLIALDAQTGKPCEGFGEQGSVNLLRGLGDVRPAEYSVTSPPLVIGERVLTGAFVQDGQRTDAPSGAVRAFDVRTGELQWVFDPVPPGTPAITAEDVKNGKTLTRGTPNVWALMSADTERKLVFLPMGNPSPDHYRGTERADKNDPGKKLDDYEYYGTSVVALDADTGAARWRFKVVNHDVWDYDLAAQPVLYETTVGGEKVPGLVVATKTGFIFLLNRETGKPLFPVEERAVPQTDVPGEWTAKTQIFPTKPEPLHPITLTRDDVWGLPLVDSADCKKKFDALRYEGVFTPPSAKGTLVYPGIGGGINWGSVSVNPLSNRMIVNLQIAPFTVQLLPQDALKNFNANDLVGTSPQQGTPYIARRGIFWSDGMRPCVPPPWGKIVAVDLNSGSVQWQHSLGNLDGLAPLGVGKYFDWGTPNTGGSMQTQSGLVFIGATLDKYFRAFSTSTGKELWNYRLPYAGHATPMSYEGSDGKQYVVIAAGGHGALMSEPGDAVVAFTLPNKKTN